MKRKIKTVCGKEIGLNNWNRHIGIKKGQKEMCPSCRKFYEDYLKNDFEKNLCISCSCDSIDKLLKDLCLGLSTIKKLYYNAFKDKITIGEIPWISDYQFEIIMESICQKYLNKSLKEYIKSYEVHQATYERGAETMFKRYGYRNYGQSKEHKENMKILNGKTKNPFCSIDMRYREYIRGKAVLPEDASEYKKYSDEVWRYTKSNAQKLEYTGKCYYTGIPICRDNNPNSQDHASIDHKESIISCFYKGISAEQCGSLENLCWTLKYFNSIKGSKTESEVRLSGLIERFIEVWNRVVENLSKEKKDEDK